MLAYHFTEMPYPYVPTEVEQDLHSSRVILPNSYCDPKLVADLYERYLDEYEYADELGLEIMLNEHHQTMTCMDAVVPISAGALARRTKPEMIRPRLRQSSIAISSATRTGLSRWGIGVPRMVIFARRVRRTSAAAEIGTMASRQVRVW